MRAPGGALLEVSIRARRFAGDAGLRDVAFSAREGEVLALFGASGSGKTTALRIILGLDRDFDGRVTPPHGTVGAVFQDPCLLPWLTLTENLRLVAPLGDPAALLAELGLGDAGALRPKQISLGMARRAALARALFVAPRLLVLDEPFASLDPLLAASLAAPITRAARAGATVLIATHEIGQVLGFADRILVLEGRPATLAADVVVPRDNADQVRAGLLARFAFMGTD